VSVATMLRRDDACKPDIQELHFGTEQPLFASHGFSCKFRHISEESIKRGISQTVYTPRTTTATAPGLEPGIKLFAPANAAALSSDGTVWPQKWLSPLEFHNILADSRRDNLDFKNTPTAIYRFSEALLSANINNPLWVSVIVRAFSYF
jgi:hypothetical protein